ncbi:expressed protein [Chlorella variabilis]|uniref:Expressed protein n=1 Tax=Chlorella variabilis TaxID=554065 RepID=E1ZNK7_CHLVA|nr:expressed protein [Chlorella variabilis]EFN52623.1 expressed protein [Chlorella variabilis]|eukprot:XP_005844725.1 expressed protein [Chlorella variabilis]
MRTCQSLALLASLALLLGATTAAAACSAEEKCVASSCGDAYGAPDIKFPYSVDYTTTGDSLTTTFHFKVCSTACDAADPLCKPLAALRLRLSDAVLAAPVKFIKLANPEGSVAASCAAAGPGWFVKGGELLSLASNNPALGETCEVITVSVYNPPGATEPIPLSQLCQQGVEVVDEAGKAVFSQDGASCLYTLELASGLSGVGQRPHPYYGGSHRRLQQAPFVRSLLSYYGPSAHHRRLAEQGVPEPLAFATRRLMEASVVPLPHRLADGGASAARHLSGYYHSSGRRLSSYYGGSHHRRLMSLGQADGFAGRTLTGYYHGSHRRLSSYYGSHRRSLMSLAGEEAMVGRTLLHGGYYHGADHRRSLMSIGEEATVGRALLHGGYYGDAHHRRSLMSFGEEATVGRALLHGGYYGDAHHRRSLMSFGEEATVGRALLHGGYYGDHHRRSMLSVGGQDAAMGRGLLHAGYYSGSHHRRRLQQAGRGLASYYGKHH